MIPFATTNTYDVIVIGSGFGGSIAANRLTLAGKRVLLLERGPWRDSIPVQSMGIEQRSPYPYGWHGLTHLLHSVHGRRLDLTLNHAGMYEFFNFSQISALVASGVGGGSTAYGSLLQPPRDPCYWHARHPELDPRLIEQHYARVLADMKAVAFGPECYTPQSVWTHFPGNPASRVRPAIDQPHMALLLPPSAREAGVTIRNSHGVERRYCAFDGDGFLGSRGGAKASVDFIYLEPAIRSGLQVQARCPVRELSVARPVDGGGYLVRYTDLHRKTDRTAQAARVVLAAGTLNTQCLLFANSGPHGTLKQMPSLGRRFGGNGDLMASWKKGPGAIPSFRSTPSQGAFTVDGVDEVDFGIGGYAGLETFPLPQFLKQALSRRYFMYGIGEDSGSGSVSYANGRLSASYDPESEPIYERMRHGFRLLAEESKSPVWVLGKPLTVHPWGGACIGANATNGVVDYRGEVYGNSGLYVADGASLPAAPGGPPSLAIAAWAHHVADGLSDA